MESLSPSAPEPAGSRPRVLRGVVAVVLMGLLLLGAILWRGGVAQGTLRGVAPGAHQVALLDHQRRTLRLAKPLPDGNYGLEVPPSVSNPRVVIHGADGAMIESGALEMGPEVRVPLLKLWSTPLRVQRQGGLLRLDWSPIPVGPGYPAKRRYSVLLVYAQEGGAQAEVSLLSAEPFLEIPLAELKGYLQKQDPARPSLTLIPRAFDPGEPFGPLWIGGSTPWLLED